MNIIIARVIVRILASGEVPPYNHRGNVTHTEFGKSDAFSKYYEESGTGVPHLSRLRTGKRTSTPRPLSVIWQLGNKERRETVQTTRCE